MVTLARRAARTPLGPVIAVMFGTVAAILVAAAPGAIFESAVVASGLPGVLSVATPPLGLTARLLAIVAAFVAVAGAILIAWRAVTGVSALRARMPWHDAGYDEPVAEDTLPARRRPIFAPEELGAPLMSEEAITSREPEPVAAAEATEPDEHLEIEMPRPANAPIEAIAAAMNDVPIPAQTPRADPIDHSIAGLIARLEAGLARRIADMPPEGGAPLALPPEWIVDDLPEPPRIRDENPDGESAMRKFAWR